jgi:uncharacterized protein YaiI (UPF0178 family)
MSQKFRRAGGRSSGPAKRTSEDDERLYYNLKKLINEANIKIIDTFYYFLDLI